jgi:hypothetical protein
MIVEGTEPASGGEKESKMKKLILGVAIVLGLGLVAAVYFCITLYMDRNALAVGLETTQNILATTQSELTTTKDYLAATQGELDQTEETLTATSDELNDTQITLTSTQSELATTSQELALKTNDLNQANSAIESQQGLLEDLQADYANTSDLLNISRETLQGLGMDVDISSECRDVELVDNPAAQNPTWNELMAFLAEDKTEQHEYIAKVYDCSQFSRDVHNNAEAAGIRAAEVQIWFQNENTGHALNAFITTDYGLVYVDCTNAPDKIDRIKLDKEVRGVDRYSISGQNVRNDFWWDSLMSYFYMSNETGGHSIVSDIMIYW